MKVALVHDYIREYGGAERVVEALHNIFPDAPVFTAYYSPEGLQVHRERIEKWDIRTSGLQKIPFAKKLISPFRIFAPMFFESFDFSEFDVVISSSAIYFAKAVLTKPDCLHIGYIHTPPRYLYGYATSFNYKKNPITNILGEFANHFLRIYDFETSQRPDILVANSKNVQERIKKFYRRDSVVVFPPVDLSEFKGVKKEKGEYYLSLNRLVRGKGTEVTVEACAKLGLPLKVAGSGPELDRLKALANEKVEFVGHVTDVERVSLYARAKALIVCSEDEDFGITAVEAQAAGTPVIAVKAGGYLETVIAGKTGEFFDRAAVESLMRVLKNFNSGKYKEKDCRANADKFSQESFRKEILKLIESNLKG